MNNEQLAKHYEALYTIAITKGLKGQKDAANYKAKMLEAKGIKPAAKKPAKVETPKEETITTKKSKKVFSRGK